MPYRPTEKTEARRLAARERIVAAALDRVAHGGYMSAGVHAVAADAGVAVGTVYRHFPSKGELFAEVFRRASQRELDVVVDVSRSDGRTASERVAASVEAFCRRALAGPLLAYALVGALAESLVGPLSTANGGSRAALIATLVQFCQEALPSAHERVHA